MLANLTPSIEVALQGAAGEIAVDPRNQALEGLQPTDVSLFSVLLGSNLPTESTNPHQALAGLPFVSLPVDHSKLTTATDPALVWPPGNPLPLTGLTPPAGETTQPIVVPAGAKVPTRQLVSASSDAGKVTVDTLLGKADLNFTPRVELRVLGDPVLVEKLVDLQPDVPVVVPKAPGPTPNAAAAGNFAAIAHTTTSGASSVVVQELPVSTNAPAFREAFASRILWMVKDGVQMASLRLNPPQLGAVNIQIVVNQSEAVVNFVVQTDPARDAIEQALPQLRNLLGQSGLNLGGAQVSSQHAQTGQGSNEQSESSQPKPDDSATADHVVRRLGLIDHYA